MQIYKVPLNLTNFATEIKQERKQKMKIVYWSDYACPYCYIGETRLKKAINNLGLNGKIDIEFKAFELDPYVAEFATETTLDRFAKKYHLTKEGAQAQIDKISSLGRGERLDFRYATTRNTNTFKAHRLTKLAHEKGGYELADKLSELLFNAYFTKNLELANPETLVSVAEQVGMDGDEVREFLKGKAYADEVRHDEQEAMLNGIQGVPYFVFNDKLVVPGALNVDNFEFAIKKVMKDEREVFQADAQQCGPNGCAFVPKSERR